MDNTSEIINGKNNVVPIEEEVTIIEEINNYEDTLQEKIDNAVDGFIAIVLFIIAFFNVGKRITEKSMIFKYFSKKDATIDSRIDTQLELIRLLTNCDVLICGVFQNGEMAGSRHFKSVKILETKVRSGLIDIKAGNSIPFSLGLSSYLMTINSDEYFTENQPTNNWFGLDFKGQTVCSQQTRMIKAKNKEDNYVAFIQLIWFEDDGICKTGWNESATITSKVDQIHATLSYLFTEMVIPNKFLRIFTS